MIKFFSETNTQKVLLFLALNTGRAYYEKEISNALCLNQSSVHVVLKELEKERFIVKESKGKMSFFSVDDNFYQVREIKILAILKYMEPLVSSLISCSYKIILFGSCAKGINCLDSDIDLYIETSDVKKVRKIICDFIEKIKDGKEIQTIIKTHQELLEKKDEVLMGQIEKGKLLFEL